MQLDHSEEDPQWEWLGLSNHCRWSLMEREILHPAWVHTNPHRTFCVGHSSRHQHKQGSGWVRVTMELCWMYIFLLYLWALHTERYLRTYPILQFETAEWQMVLRKPYNSTSAFWGGKTFSFHLFLVKKPKEQENRKPNKKPPPTTNNQSTKPQHQTQTTKPNTSQYNSRHTAWTPGKLKARSKMATSRYNFRPDLPDLKGNLGVWKDKALLCLPK